MSLVDDENAKACLRIYYQQARDNQGTEQCLVSLALACHTLTAHGQSCELKVIRGEKVEVIA